MRLAEGKGLDDLLRAFAILHRQQPCNAPARRRRPLSGANLVSLPSTSTSARSSTSPAISAIRAPFMDAMDIFVLPVPAGSMSIALLEAMGRGLPPVITFCGPEEAVISDETGICAPPNNPRGLAVALTRLAADPDLRRQLAASAAEHVSRHFSIGRVADDYLELYETAHAEQMPARMRADAPPNPRPGAGRRCVDC